MDLTVKTAPTDTSISKELVKASKRISHESEDNLIDFWIKAADDYIEQYTNRALMTQTLVLRLDRILPVVCLPRPPLASITHVKYTPKDGSEVTVAGGDRATTNKNMASQIEITDLTEQAGTMEIEYVVGAASMDNVPAALRQAALLLVGHYVTSREAVFLDPRVMNIEKKIKFGVDELCNKYRVPNIAELNGGH